MKQRPIFAIYVLLWIVALVGLSNARVIAQSTDSLSVKPAIKDSLQKILSSFQTLQSLTLPLQKEQIRGSYRLSVAFFKTSHIIFDSKIVYFDIGSKNIIGEKAENLENVLKLKAAYLESFETNVTVVTASGKYYSFLVNHSENPSKLNVVMEPIVVDWSNQNVSYNQGKGKILLSGESMDEASFKRLSAYALEQKNIKHIRSIVGNVSVEVQSILTKGNMVMVSLKLKNKSSLNYEVDYLKAYIRDKDNSKRDVTQELEVKPVYVYLQNQSKTPKTIGDAKGEYGLVLLFNKFSIAEHKTFDLDMVEKNGGRNFHLVTDFATFYNQMEQL